MPFNLKNWLVLEGMATRQVHREKYDWYPLDTVLAGNAPEVNTMVEKNSYYRSAIGSAARKRKKNMARLSGRYAANEEQLKKMYQFYIGSSPVYGLYYLAVGPYMAPFTDWTHFQRWCINNGFVKNENGQQIVLINEAIQSVLNTEKELRQQERTAQDEENRVAVAEGRKPNKIPKIDRVVLYSKQGNHTLPKVAHNLRQDLDNSFAFFSRRFQEKDDAAVKKSAIHFLSTKIPEYLGYIDFSDLQFELITEKDEDDEDTDTTEISGEGSIETPEVIDPFESLKETRGRKKIKEYQIFNDLSENSGTMTHLKENPPVMGEGSGINLSAKGLKKIISSFVQNRQSPLKIELTKIITDHPELIQSIKTDIKQKNKEISQKITDFIMSSDTISPTIDNLKNQKMIAREGVQRLYEQIISEAGNKDLNSYYQEEISKDGNQQGASLAQEAYRYALDSISGALHIPEKNVEDVLETRYEVVRQLYKAMLKYQEQKTEEGDPRVSLMTHMPEFDNLKKRRGTVGAQISEPLRVRPTQIQVAQIKKEILEIISQLGNENPQLISNKLNETRTDIKGRKAKGIFTAAEIPGWITIIKQDKQRFGATNEELLEFYENDLEKLTEGRESAACEGFKSLDDAYRAANEHYAGSKGEKMLDPKTGTRLTFEDVPTVIPRESSDNFTAQDLSQMREATGNIIEEKARIPNTAVEDVIGKEETEKPEDIKEIKEEKPEEIKDKFEEQQELEDLFITDISPESEKEQILDFPITEETTESPTEETKTFPVDEIKKKEQEKKKKQQTQETEYDVNDLENDFLISKTLNTLIKISRELDKEGKCKASEEVHKVIRKYIK